MKALAFVFALLALSVLAPPTTAQGVPPVCVVDATQVLPAAIPPGGTGTVSIVVKNTGQSPQPANVSVTAATAAGTGWTVTDTGTQQLSLASGASATVSVHVAASKDVKDSGVINFSVSGDCPPPSPLPCPNSQCAFATRNVSVTVPVAGAGGFAVPGLDGVPIEYLAGGALLVVLAVVLVVALPKRAKGFRADCPEPVKALRPGRGASFPVDVRNETDEPLTARFDLSAVPEGWTAFLPLPEVQLAPKEARSLWLMIRAPPTARAGEHVDVEVKLTDVARPRVVRAIKVRAEVNPDAPETPPR